MMDEQCERSYPVEDPIHQNADGTWWFWAEDWCSEYGPYPTREAAVIGINKYAAEVLGV